jgi:hypothetical protein
VSSDKDVAFRIYCGREVDDFGLPMPSFRLLLHLSRRTNKKLGYAKCGIRSISRVCGMVPRTAVQAVRNLEKLNIIRCERSEKRTTRYYINSFEQWTKTVASNDTDIKSKLLPQMTQGVASNDTDNCVKRNNERLTTLLKEKPKKAKNAFTRNERSSVSRKLNHQKKPFAVATEESIRELQKRHPRLDVHALFPEAQKACAEKYPDGGPMRHAYFENYLDIEEQKLGPPGLIEGQQRKQEQREEAARDRMEADQQREMDEAEDIQRPPMNLKEAVLDQIKRLR